MKRLAFALLTLTLSMLAMGPAKAENDVVVLDIEGGIGVATREYLLSGIEYAEDNNAALVLIELDTPGGLVKPMRDMVQAMLSSEVPIATYVTPAGARADSAGTYMMFASHIAAMTPTTHLGAATPVTITGGDTTPPAVPGQPGEVPNPRELPAEEEPAQGGSAMDRKVLNDAVAYIRSLAERYDRNADWAELAVTEAATLTAKEALEQNVIDFVFENRDELIAGVDGTTVKLDSGETTVVTEGAQVEEFEPGWRIKFLSLIANPEIVLLLGLIGVYGLLIEGWNPGGLLPGIVGIISLLLAAYALQILPVNYAGLALIVVGIGLMIAEAFAPSFGALGLGGVAAFTFGAILMFDSGIPGFGISLAFVLVIAGASALFIVWLVSYLLKLTKRGAVSGTGSIIGGTGTAMRSFQGSGKVWLEGEAWNAKSSQAIEKDQEVIVEKMDGLTLIVRPVSGTVSAEGQTN